MREPARSILGEAERSQITRDDFTGDAKPRQYGLRHGIGIDVNQRSLWTKNNHAGHRLVFGMTCHVGIAASPGNTAEECNIWPRCAKQQQERGGQRSEQNSVEDSQKQYSAKRNRGRVEIKAAHAPHVKQRCEIEQAQNRSQDNCGQYRLRQIFQQAP